MVKVVDMREALQQVREKKGGKAIVTSEDLNKGDEKTIKPIIKQLKKSVTKHAQQAKTLEKDIADEKIIKIISEYINPGDTKILDLGAGPGLYCKRFYDLGAFVTWHDISIKYKISAFTLMKSNNQNWNFKLDIIDNIEGKYDIIFNRVCWYYCLNDNKFLKSIYNSLNHSGVFIGVLHNENRLSKSYGIKRLLLKLHL